MKEKISKKKKIILMVHGALSIAFGVIVERVFIQEPYSLVGLGLSLVSLSCFYLTTHKIFFKLSQKY